MNKATFEVEKMKFEFQYTGRFTETELAQAISNLAYDLGVEDLVLNNLQQLLSETINQQISLSQDDLPW